MGEGERWEDDERRWLEGKGSPVIGGATRPGACRSNLYAGPAIGDTESLYTLTESQLST